MPTMKVLPNNIIRLDCNLPEESMDIAGVRSFRKLREALVFISGQIGAVELLIEPGVYWLDDPDGQEIIRAEEGEAVPYGITVQLPKLTITGCGNASEIVLAANRGQSHGAVGNYTIFRFICDSLTLRNVTLGNYCSVDLVYPADATQNHKRRTESVTQAQIGQMDGDKFFAENCRFVGRLNLNPVVGAARSLYHACHFESTDDALNGNAVYVKCDFDFYGRRPLYATGGLGAVFLGCDFTYHVGTEDERKAYFTKMGGHVVVVDGTFKCAEELELCWAGCPQGGQVCYQRNIVKNGQTAVIGACKLASMQSDVPKNAENDITVVSSDMLEQTTRECSVLLSDTALRAFRLVHEGKVIYNTYNLLAGADAWDSMNCKEAAMAQHADRLPVGLKMSLSDTVLTCGEDAYVIMQVANRFVGDCLELVTEGINISIISDTSTVDEPFLEITQQEDGSFRIASKYVGTKEKTVQLKVTTELGLVAVTELACLPRLKAAPEFAKEPVLEYAPGVLLLDYELETVEHRGDTKTEEVEERTEQDEIVQRELIAEQDDISELSWYRCVDKAGREDILVAITRYRAGKKDMPQREYWLSETDIGYYIKAEIVPGGKGCEKSDCKKVLYSARISNDNIVDIDEVDEKFKIYTDFRNFPVVQQPLLRRGFWTVDSYRPDDTASLETWYGDENCAMPWVYGTLGNNCADYGIYQGVQGARLIYTPVRDNFSAMSLRLIVTPAKTLGQGFGSAGQYMDVLIHVGSEGAGIMSMHGYGLRIMRKTEASDACYFMLVRYVAGVVEILSEQVPASCYRGDCTIAVKTVPAGVGDGGMQLWADAMTNAEQLSGHRQKDYQHEVHLRVKISESASEQYGIMIVHTGTTGAGGWQNTTMLKELEVRWE